MNRFVQFYALLGLAVALVAMPAPAHAYIGPGAGLAAITTFLALIGGVFLGIVGFLWYPIKRLLRSMRKSSEGDDSTPAE